LLAACGGGGGGGGGGSAPTPSAATAQAGFALPTGGAGSTVIAENGSGGGGTTVRYTSGGSATVSVGGVTRSWRGSPTVVGDVEVTESADGRTVVVTAKDGANTAGTGGNLSYASYGIWLESNAVSVLAGSSNQVTRVSSFVVGNATPVGDMPGSGSATYRGQAVAVELNGNASPRTLSGPLNATADFASGQVTATADLTGSADGSSFGRVSMSNLAISGNTFSGSATSSAGHTGSAEGGFAGPSAVELGGTFELNGPSTVHGAFAGTSR
jgi:hypothetical protein